MKRQLLTMLMTGTMACGAGAQQVNGTFDATWETCTPYTGGSSKTVGTQPQGWKAANVAGYYLFWTWWGTTTVVEKVSGRSGNAVKMTNQTTSGNVIPGYMALGTPWNTANTSGGNADGGTFGGLSFSKRPDALEFYYQRSLGASGNSQPASVVAYLWKGSTTQQNVPVSIGSSPTKVTMTNRDANVLGRTYSQGGAVSRSSDFELIATIGAENEVAAEQGYRAEVYLQDTPSAWTKVTCPLTYHSNSTPTMINIIFAAMENYAGKASNESGNSLTVDDVSLVYWHALSDLKIGGQTLSGFSESTLNYEVEGDYDASAVSYTKKGQGATVAQSYNAETRTLTLTVTSEVGESTAYRVVYKTPNAVVSQKTYAEPLYVTINGMTAGPQTANVVVGTQASGRINFTLENFMLEAGTEVLPVGNIAINDLEVTDQAFAYTGNITITEGNQPGIDTWLGPGLGPIPMVLVGKFVDEDHVLVSIDIDLQATMGQLIKVHLGYDRASLAVSSAKYGTFVAPFEVTIPSGVQAYKVSGVQSNVLTLEILSGTLPAHTPVVVESETEVSSSFFGQAGSTTAPSNGLLTGVYADTPAPVGTYVLQSQDEKVGFYLVSDVNQPTVKANRCYLTAPAGGGVKAFYLDQATAVSAIEALTEGLGQIYDLQGRQRQTLQRGINIVNGQKILVK